MKILCKKRYMKMDRKISKPETDNLTFIKEFCRNIKTGIKIPVYNVPVELFGVFTEFWKYFKSQNIFLDLKSLSVYLLPRNKHFYNIFFCAEINIFFKSFLNGFIAASA